MIISFLKWLKKRAYIFVLKQVAQKSGNDNVVLSIQNYGRHVYFYIYSLLSSYGEIAVTKNSDLSIFKFLMRFRDSSYTINIVKNERDNDYLRIKDKDWDIEYDYFKNNDNAFYMPFYEHPNYYITETTVHESEKKITILFAGSGLTNSYDEQYHFSTMTRNDILRHVRSQFSNLIQTQYPQSYEENNHIEICLLINSIGKNTMEKYEIPQTEYYRLLNMSEFFLCTPGLRIPHSHNLIESMRLGVIPITNYNDYIYPGLTDGENALLFSNEEELDLVVKKALHMSQKDKNEMQEKVIEYYKKYFDPNGYWLRWYDTLKDYKILKTPVSILSPEESGIT